LEQCVDLYRGNLHVYKNLAGESGVCQYCCAVGHLLFISCASRGEKALLGDAVSAICMRCIYNDSIRVSVADIVRKRGDMEAYF